MVRPKTFAFVVAIAIAGACEIAQAQPRQTRFTLEVDTDAPDVVSHDAIGEDIARELGAEGPRVELVIRYRDADRTLVVRAKHDGGRVVERTVKAEGDAAAIRKEAVLLAGNVARDEARELIDALSARPPKPPPPAAPPPPSEPAPAPQETPTAPSEEEVRVLNGGLAYPLSSNFGRPGVTTYFDFSLLFGLVGKVKGAQIGTGAAMAREIRGAQIGAGAAIARNVEGAQLSPVAIADEVTGAQIGVVNIARRVKGAQVGVVNIADEVDGGAAGLVSISRDSIHPIAWAGNLGYFNAGIAFESKYVYTILAMTYGSLETGIDPSVGGVGAIGTRLRVWEGLDVGLESSFSAIEPVPATTEGTNTWFHQRALLGWRFARRARVFAGGGFRAPIAVVEGSNAIRPDFIGGFEF
jgi:hypothetical protein